MVAVTWEVLVDSNIFGSNRVDDIYVVHMSIICPAFSSWYCVVPERLCLFYHIFHIRWCWWQVIRKERERIWSKIRAIWVFMSASKLFLLIFRFSRLYSYSVHCPISSLWSKISSEWWAELMGTEVEGSEKGCTVAHFYLQLQFISVRTWIASWIGSNRLMVQYGRSHMCKPYWTGTV